MIFMGSLVVNVDNGFDGAEFWVGEFVKFGGNLFDVEAVSDPDLGVDVSGFDGLNDLAKVCGQGIT